MDEQLTAARKYGPAKRLPDTKPYTLMLEPDFAEWGKRQPGGLSDLVRRLLKEAKDRATVATA